MTKDARDFLKNFGQTPGFSNFCRPVAVYDWKLKIFMYYEHLNFNIFIHILSSPLLSQTYCYNNGDEVCKSCYEGYYHVCDPTDENEIDYKYCAKKAGGAAYFFSTCFGIVPFDENAWTCEPRYE